MPHLCRQCKLSCVRHRTIPRLRQLVPLKNQVPDWRAELEESEVWSVQGQRGTCVTNGHPPPNLGRNLFPPRRFSYHTRFSRFNGTARQPSPVMGTCLHHPVSRRYAPLSGAAKYPAGARPSKCIIISIENTLHIWCHDQKSLH
jgi:hypothetical protein